jgi:multidrug efflux pump
MSIADFSVKRPVSVTVLMLVILLFGYLNLKKLPIREYPNIEIPSISISTQYTGASSKVVETKITQPIENAIAGIEGLEDIHSTSKDGKSAIKLEFSINRDLDDAANDVRDRIAKAAKSLPIGAESPIVSKYDSNSTPVMMVTVTSNSMNNMQLHDYAKRYIIDRFSVIEGVASVNLLSQYEKSMRIWMNRKKMASHGITVTDVETALKAENSEYPTGRIESLDNEFPVILNKQYSTPEDFKKIIIARDEDNNPIRISDIAKVSIESKVNRGSFKVNMEDVVSFGISKQSTANALTISKKARSIIEEIQKKLPNDMKLRVLSDEALFIEDSIMEVFGSLIMASILVFFIVYIFIGTFKAAIIPVFSIPISIIGSSIVMNMLGYSINMLTLLAMVLAIGIVVDDAILVLENVQRHMEEGKESHRAAIDGTKQVLFAVISTTVVLVAVFMPISLLPGKTGKLFTEFSVAISSAVFISSIVALTLTPMMCAKLLQRPSRTKLSESLDKVVKKSQDFYLRILKFAVEFKNTVIVSFLAITVITILITKYTPGEFEPKEDRNSITLKIKAPNGTGYYRMLRYVDALLEKIYPFMDKKVAKNILSAIPGLNDSAAGAVNSGVVILDLVDMKKRNKSSFQIAEKCEKLLAKIPGVNVSTIMPMGIGAKGTNASLRFALSGNDYEELEKWKDIIFEEAMKYPGISNIDSDYENSTPTLRVNIDKDMAGYLNINTQTIGEALEAMLGSKKLTTFTDKGQEYDVILQADRSSRDEINDISNMYVKAQNSKELIPLDNLVTIKEIGEANKIERYNRSRSIIISGNISNSYSMSDALEFIENTVKEKLPPHAQISYIGQSKDYKESENNMIFVFTLAVIISYLVLAAQFESFLNPLIVMLTVPLGAFGAAFVLFLLGQTTNIYTQIGMIMLIGLTAKHGILIVEFANQLIESGMKFREAILKASILRLRPIMMTGISTVLGAIPLVIATGASSASRQSLGIVQVFGGISGIFLTLLVIPVGYYLSKQFCHSVNDSIYSR